MNKNFWRVKQFFVFISGSPMRTLGYLKTDTKWTMHYLLHYWATAQKWTSWNDSKLVIVLQNSENYTCVDFEGNKELFCNLPIFFNWWYIPLSPGSTQLAGSDCQESWVLFLQAHIVHLKRVRRGARWKIPRGAPRGGPKYPRGPTRKKFLSLKVGSNQFRMLWFA